MLISIRSAFLVVLVASAFTFVCMMVWLTRNSPYWVNKKLYLGGLLILLTALVSGCRCRPESPPPTCYLSILMLMINQTTVPAVQTEQQEKLSDHLEATGFTVDHYSNAITNARKGNLQIKISSTDEKTSIELSTSERAPVGMRNDEWKEKVRNENKKIMDDIINIVEENT